MIEISPATATLEVIDSAAATQAFVVTAHFADGATRDITRSVDFAVQNSAMGRFDGGVLTVSGLAAGPSTITATYKGLSASASITVLVRQTAVAEPAPAQAPEWFGSATEDPALAPAIMYPTDGVLIPPNLNDFDIHWYGSAGHDVFEVTLLSDYVEMRTYVTGTPGAGSWRTVEPALWSAASASQRGGSLTMRVRSLSSAAPETMGSAAITMQITEQAVEGGIYYWAAASEQGAAGIYRHDMGRAGAAAEPIYTTDDTDGVTCVGCHVLSRDGTRMAITIGGGDQPATILDVASQRPLLPTDGSFRWNFASFSPDGSRMLGVYMGVLTLYDASNGAVLATVPTNGYATHPEISPLGDAIVYVTPTLANSDWQFWNGAIVVQDFDAATNTFGAARTVVASDISSNYYYPSWSPNGQWLLFNRSPHLVHDETSDSYDDASAELYVVKADGSLPPIRLDGPSSSSGLTNSWARWVPFAQTLGANQEPFLWFTFSSRRDFGTRLVGLGRPQIWMAPFFPMRAQAGSYPSAPAFRLPAQNIDDSNHIAQWTEKAVAIE